MHTRPRRALLLAFCVALSSARAGEPLLLDAVEVTGQAPAYLAGPAQVTATVYDGLFLESVGVSSFADLAPLVPGLFVSEQSIANSSYSLRGVTTDNGDPRGVQRVSVFQDGVLISNNAGINVALFDLERVDVLKGPQPAAFGRGTQIGAIAITTRKPLDKTSAELAAGFGNYNSRTVSGHLNLPLIEESLFARIAFTVDRADGYVDNLADGSDLQGRDTVALRGRLRWQPTPQTTADLIVNYQHDTPPGVAFKSMVVPLSDGNPYTAANLNRGSALGADRTLHNLTGIVTHEIGDNWTLSSTTGWRDVDAAEEFDADGSPLYLLEAGEYTRARQFSQDIRLSWDAGGRLNGSVGAGFFWEKASQRIPTRSDLNTLYTLLAGTPPPVPLPASYEESFINHGETLSGDLFGDIGYQLTPRLKLGASLRVTHEELTSGYQSFLSDTPMPFGLISTGGGGNAFFAPTPGRLETERDLFSWSGAVNAGYELNKNHSLYGSVSRGRRPPYTSFLLGSPFPINSRQEEVVLNYEIGLKGASPGRRISYNIAAFRYDYSNFETQTVTPPALPVQTDGGRATAQGVEVVVQGTVSDHLSVFAAYGFTDTEFAALDDDGSPQIYAGNSFRLAARHTLTLGLTGTLRTDRLGTFFITPSWEYKSEHYFEDDNQRSGGTLRQGGFALVHLRAGWRAESNRWEVVFWVRNLLDKDYLIDAGNIGGDFGFPTSVRAAPRTLGVNLTARF